MCTQVKADTRFAGLDEVAALFELMTPYLDKILNSTVGDAWFKEEAPSLFASEFLSDLHQNRKEKI